MHPEPFWIDADPDAWRRAGGVSSSTRVHEVMSFPAIVLDPEDKAGHALALAAEHGVHHFPVEWNTDLVGIVCLCDLRDAAADDPVSAHMSRRVITISPHALLSEASERMDDHGINCLVTSWRGAIGVVTRGDLVRWGGATRRRCSTCGDSHHVREHEMYADHWYCLDCIEPRSDPVGQLYDDQGGGD